MEENREKDGIKVLRAILLSGRIQNKELAKQLNIRRDVVYVVAKRLVGRALVLRERTYIRDRDADGVFRTRTRTFWCIRPKGLERAKRLIMKQYGTES